MGSCSASSHLTARSNCGTFFFELPVTSLSSSLVSPPLSSTTFPSLVFDAGLDWRVFLLRGFSSSSSWSPRFRLLLDAGFFAPEGPPAASGFASFRRAASYASPSSDLRCLHVRALMRNLLCYSTLVNKAQIGRRDPSLTWFRHALVQV